jgi:hypothetical protein
MIPQLAVLRKRISRAMEQDMRSESAISILALAAKDLACYCVACWPQFELAAHHKIIIEKLEAVERGEILRLILTLPPRHGKSLLTAQMFPAWYLGRHPDRLVICASYAQELSDDFGRRVRNLVSDPLHQAIFPGCRLAEDSSSMRRFNTSAGGSYYAVGRGGPITGRGAHLLIIDDPIKDREEAQSETIRRGLHQWFSDVAYTRLQPGASIVLLQTRWHENDLAGWLLDEHKDEGWHVLSLPAIAEQDETWRREGEALWPSHFPLQTLEMIRSAIGSSAWASLYQQRPSAAEGAIFKREWWQHFTELPTSGNTIQSWDCAFKAKSTNDFSVCSTWIASQQGYCRCRCGRAESSFRSLSDRLVRRLMRGSRAPSWLKTLASGQSLI